MNSNMSNTPTPLCLGDWSCITTHGDSDHVYVGGRGLCVISAAQAAPVPSDAWVHVVTFPRPDELFEHIYIMGQSA